jgi:hypothetical protein
MPGSPVFRRICGAVLLLGFLSTGGYLQARTKKSAPKAEVKRQPLQKEDVYLPSVVQWERPGAARPDDWTSARTRVNIAVFYPSGEFVGGSISLARQADGELVPQPKEDYSLRRGTWTRNGREVLVQSQWVKVEGPPPSKKKKKKYKMVKETWVTDPQLDNHLSHYLVIGAKEYVQADSLRNLEALEKMLSESAD